jgi:hypothetical protein
MNLVLLATLLACAPAARADKPRIKTLISSSQELLDDVKYLVADLAREETQWEQNIKDAIESFLFGVDYGKPIRFDVLLGGGEQGGYRFQPSIPISNLKAFREENLEVIGIDPKLRGRDYYLLEGDVYQGYMRILRDYACIAAKGFEDDIPKGMPHPSETHRELLAREYDLAVELISTPEQADERRAQFEPFRANVLDSLQQKEDEQDYEFAVREVTTTQQIERMARMYVEARQITIGWMTDRAGQRGVAEFLAEGLPGTEFARFLELMAAESSLFAGLAMPADPVLGVRLNLPFDAFRKQQFAAWYEVVRPSVARQIEQHEDFSPDEKPGATQCANLIIDMLVAGIDMGRLDLAVDITRAASGKHVIVCGVRAADGKAADKIVELLPQARKQWKVQLNAHAVGETQIHEIDISGQTLESLVRFFGESHRVYVGTSANQVWIAGGEESLARLTETITASTAAAAGEVSPTFGELRIQGRPLLQLAHELTEETGFKLFESIQFQRKGKIGLDKQNGGSAEMKPIDPREMREIILQALVDHDDHIHAVVHRSGSAVTGQMIVAPGILRSVGKVAAKIAADNLN